MITVKKKLTLPEYRERKEVYEILGYKEKEVKKISDFKVVVTYEIDNEDHYYPTLRILEKKLYRKGPPFFPVIIMVLMSFVLLSCFVVLLAKEGENFDLLSRSLSFLLPGFLILFADVLYTAFYFAINKKIIEEVPIYKRDIASIVNSIRNK